MYRNDTGLPYVALLFSAALFLAAWLDGRFVGQLAGKPLASLTVGQVAMAAFAALLLVYAAIGYLSVWFEGRELRPGRRAPHAGRAVAPIAALLTVALVAGAGLFVRLIARAPAAQSPAPLEGGVAAAVFLLVATLLSLQKKYLMAREVLTEDESDEVRW